MAPREYLGSTSFFWSPGEGIVVKSLHPVFIERHAINLTVERKILEHLGRHPRVVQYLGFNESFPTGIRLAEANGGTLQTYLETQGHIIEQAIRNSLSRQLLEAIAFLHSRDVIHSDLRPENCLLQKTDSMLDLLLCDFGGSMCSSRDLDGLGLPDAPFWNLEWETTIYTDLFAAGSVIYSIMTGSWPFKKDNDTENKSQYEDRVNELIKLGKLPETQAVIGGRVVRVCWTQRDYTAEEALKLLNACLHT